MQRAVTSRVLQAELDFAAACPLLELHERIVEDQSIKDNHERLISMYNELRKKWYYEKLKKMIPFANDSMTIQLGEMFQHLHDIDSGDIPLPASAPQLDTQAQFASAAFNPSVGPSTHTNPAPTLEFQMKALYEDEVSKSLHRNYYINYVEELVSWNYYLLVLPVPLIFAQRRATEARVRHILTKRHGFSLWVGPTQAPTPSHVAGVYVKGRVEPGTVVALFPGAVYNSEMLQARRPFCLSVLIACFFKFFKDLTSANIPHRHRSHQMLVTSATPLYPVSLFHVLMKLS